MRRALLGSLATAFACADNEATTGAGESESGGAELQWPDRLEHESLVEFTASSQAESFGYEDCVVDVSSLLAPFPIPDQCLGCERGYRGGLAYHEDSCSAQAGVTPPTGVSFGMRARAPDLDVWGLDDKGVWTMLGRALAQDDGAWVLIREEPVRVTVGIGQIDAGVLVATLTFRPQ